ncbi:MAG: hypothetical protein QNJ67_23190 [Kiloniellales bacterium]|nr:hypothetical protein [Kiloniellales bacterium]
MQDAPDSFLVLFLDQGNKRSGKGDGHHCRKCNVDLIVESYVQKAKPDQDESGGKRENLPQPAKTAVRAEPRVALFAEYI